MQMRIAEARGRQGAKLEILSDCPNAGKEREEIAVVAIGKLKEIKEEKKSCCCC